MIILIITHPLKYPSYYHEMKIPVEDIDKTTSQTTETIYHCNGNGDSNGDTDMPDWIIMNDTDMPDCSSMNDTYMSDWRWRSYKRQRIR